MAAVLFDLRLECCDIRRIADIALKRRRVPTGAADQFQSLLGLVAVCYDDTCPLLRQPDR